MNKPKLSQEGQEYLQLIEIKKRNRDKLLAAIAAASPEDLERVAVSIKAALCKSGPPARPRSFASIQEKLEKTKFSDE